MPPSLIYNVTAAHARQRFSEMVSMAAFGKVRVVVSRGGRPRAALVSIEDMAQLNAIDEELDLDAAKAIIRAAWFEGREVPWDKVRRALRRAPRIRAAREGSRLPRRFSSASPTRRKG